METNLKPKREPAILFIFFTILLDVIGFGLIIPVTPNLISHLKGIPVEEAATYGGLLLTVYAVVQFFCSPIIGGLSDKFGRRPVLLLALLGFSLDYFLTAWAPTFTWLFVGRVIAGITGSSISTASSYIADVSTAETRAKNFGVIGAAFGIGFIIGPLLGAFAAEIFNMRAPFILAGILTFCNFLFGYFILPESLKKENRRPFSWLRANPVGTIVQLNKFPKLISLLVSLFCMFLASWAVQGTWNFYTQFRFQWTNLQIGISLGIVGLLVGAVQGGLVRITIPKFGQTKNIVYGTILFAIGSLCFAFAPTGLFMYLALIPYCLGGVGQPALQAAISSQIPPNQQGELQGGLTSLQSLSAIFGPLIMSNIFSFFSSSKAPILFPGAAFALGSLLFLLSAGLAYRALKKN